MKFNKQLLSILATVFLLNSVSAKEEKQVEALILNPGPITGKYDKHDLEVAYDESSIELQCSGNTCSSSSDKVTVEEGKVTIKNAGTFILGGDLTGQVNINAGKKDLVHFVFRNMTINSEYGPALYGEKAKRIIITTEGENSIVDSVNYPTAASGSAEEDDENTKTPNACIYVNDDLTLNGKGSLSVDGKFDEAIRVKKDLKFVSGKIDVNAKGKGIKVKNSVSVKEADINVNAGNSGIKVTKDTDPEKGFIVIDGGKVVVKCGNDGIHAETHLTINDGYIEVNDCDEGLEGQMIDIIDGEIVIHANDDGINASKIGAIKEPKPSFLFGDDNSNNVFRRAADEDSDEDSDDYVEVGDDADVDVEEVDSADEDSNVDVDVNDDADVDVEEEDDDDSDDEGSYDCVEVEDEDGDDSDVDDEKETTTTDYETTITVEEYETITVEPTSVATSESSEPTQTNEPSIEPSTEPTQTSELAQPTQQPTQPTPSTQQPFPNDDPFKDPRGPPMRSKKDDEQVYVKIVGGKVSVLVDRFDVDGIDSNGALYIGGNAEVSVDNGNGDIFGNMAALDSNGSNTIDVGATVIVTAGGMDAPKDEQSEMTVKDLQKIFKDKTVEELEAMIEDMKKEQPKEEQGFPRGAGSPPPNGEGFPEGAGGPPPNGEGFPEGPGGPPPEEDEERAYIKQPYLQTEIEYTKMGHEIVIKDSKDKTVFTYKPKAGFAQILYSSPKLVEGETYTINVSNDTKKEVIAVVDYEEPKFPDDE